MSVNNAIQDMQDLKGEYCLELFLLLAEADAIQKRHSDIIDLSHDLFELVMAINDEVDTLRIVQHCLTGK